MSTTRTKKYNKKPTLEVDTVLATKKRQGRKAKKLVQNETDNKDMENEIHALDLLRTELEMFLDIESGEAVIEITLEYLEEAQNMEDLCQNSLRLRKKTRGYMRDSTETISEQGERSTNLSTNHTQTTSLATGASYTNVVTHWRKTHVRKSS